MGLMRDLNQYLQKRGERWHYVRRVPAEYADFDTRAFIRKSLKTESLELARIRRDELVAADDQYWAEIVEAAGGLPQSEDIAAEAAAHAARQYEAAKRKAMSKGFLYVQMDDLVEKVKTTELLKRLEALEKSGRGRSSVNDNTHVTGVAPQSEVEALLGAVKPPTVTINQAFEIYCHQIAVSELVGKSDAQKALWRKTKLRAVTYFIELFGDLPMDVITRDHARAFYNWWAERLKPKGNKKGLSANSANRDIGNLRKLYREYWTYQGEENKENPFRNLSFKDTTSKDVPHFEDEWVRTRILDPDVFAKLNPQAMLLIYALIETGCRPSEIANLEPENIILDHDVPHIRIRATDTRQLKSPTSQRDIPLVGVSLEAMHRAPQGFPHYRDKGSLLSASLMKAFRTRNLFPTEQHRIYSFRHSFEKRMLEAGLDYGLRCLLMGHKHDRPAYGDGGSLAYRRDELLKIAHPTPDEFADKLPNIY